VELIKRNEISIVWSLDAACLNNGSNARAMNLDEVTIVDDLIKFSCELEEHSKEQKNKLCEVEKVRFPLPFAIRRHHHHHWRQTHPYLLSNYDYEATESESKTLIRPQLAFGARFSSLGFHFAD